MTNRQREYWNSVLDAQNLREGTELGFSDVEKEIRFTDTPDQNYAYSLMGGVEGKKILEIGGGIGVNAINLARMGARVYVVDIAEERLKILRQLASDLGLSDAIHISQMQGEYLGFPNGFFDIVYTKSVLIHTDIEGAAAEIARTLKKGGIGVFIEPFTKHPLVNLYRRTCAPDTWREITNYFDQQRIELLTRPFERFHVKRFYLFSFFAFFWQFGVRSLPLYRLSIKLLSLIDNALFTLLPFLRKYSWFGVISVKK